MLFRLLSIVLFAAYAAAQPSPNLTLRGTVKGAQNNTYIEAPFTVPAHTRRLTVAFHYTGKEEKTTLDLGVEDPHGFRGWSGGNKSTFTISADDATPSYLPGELVAGEWKLLIGVPNIRPQSTASSEAEVFFEPAGTAKTDAFTDTPLRQ